MRVVNDADAAGIAEMRFGAGKGRKGVVVMVTLGTGIGSAASATGSWCPASWGTCRCTTRMPRTGLRSRCASTTTCWKKWAHRLEKYLELVQRLLWPDLIVIGGGVSKKADKFLPYLELRTEIVPAQLLNDAGIVGAALFAPPGKLNPSLPHST